ncbi:MAG: hypothetical protein ACM3QU_08155 [Verrucomicrobiota bacterium]
MAGHYESIGIERTRTELGPLIVHARASVRPRHHRDGGATYEMTTDCAFAPHDVPATCRRVASSRDRSG